MFVSFDENNNINGFYEDGYANLPINSLPITEELAAEALDLINMKGMLVKYSDGVLTPEKRPRSLKSFLKENERYLAETDWYVTRLTEEGKPIPEEIRLKRQEAKTKINELREEIKKLNS